MKKRRIRNTLRQIGHNIVSIHHLVWGKGWARFLLAIAVTIIIAVILMTVTLEVTSTPKFCNSCHNMRPYYQSWKQSSHHNVTCTKCHFPPGIKNKIKGKFTAMSMLVNYFTGVYKRSKPWAEISDKSCMRSGCHESRLLSGEVLLDRQIRFDHTPHLTGLRRDKKLRCTSCHSQIVQGSHISVTMDTCFLCHFKDTSPEESITSCRICHMAGKVSPKNGEQPVFDHSKVDRFNMPCQDCHGSMTKGDGAVPKNRCNTCHADIDKLKMYHDTAFMHKNHITDHKIECQQCHMEIRHISTAAADTVKSGCNTCHPDFHTASLKIFSGTGGEGIPSFPDPMYRAGLNCNACHKHMKKASCFAKKGTTLYADAETCVGCHEAGYKKILENWQQQTSTLLRQIGPALETAQRTINKKKNHPGFSRAGKLLEQGQCNYNLVKYGNGVHNITYAYHLLEKSHSLAQESLTAVGVNQKLPDFDRSSRFIPKDCSGCHAGFEEKPLPVFGTRIQFLHRKHLGQESLTCGKCHGQEPEHGRLLLTQGDCMNCHHRQDRIQKKASCEGCHPVQQKIYNSSLEFSTYDIPNPMAESVGCMDCHMNDKKQVVRPGKKICSQCHEPDYEAMFDEWQSDGFQLLKKLREKVKQEKVGPKDPAYRLLLLLETDGSSSIHNPELYEKVTEEAMRK